MQLWASLDPILLDGNTITPVTTTSYTAAILEYRVVVHGPGTKMHEEAYEAKMNGHAVHDANHPCRYSLLGFYLIVFEIR